MVVNKNTYLNNIRQVAHEFNISYRTVKYSLLYGWEKHLVKWAVMI